MGINSIMGGGNCYSDDRYVGYGIAEKVKSFFLPQITQI
ncbi:Uncharacterized protein dnl_14450 [Desulfonema limicola]|uniref:Uncharacterized protein n=1 Tax=Desulfonema limicola TaxID=45656 RepID=A0A975B5I7_9BACT|nr:Uncharacterized protein dnl_14450 [Desulfonema limicola]